MSLASWKAEFYPISASEVVPGLDSIEHSLRKWIGALPENVAKHECNYEYHIIMEDDIPYDSIVFDSDSCALCMHYKCDSNPHPEDSHYSYPTDSPHPVNPHYIYPITVCPIAVILNGSCDAKENHIYLASKNNPEPMIEVLNQAKVWFLKQVK